MRNNDKSKMCLLSVPFDSRERLGVPCSKFAGRSIVAGSPSSAVLLMGRSRSVRFGIRAVMVIFEFPVGIATRNGGEVHSSSPPGKLTTNLRPVSSAEPEDEQQDCTGILR